uniref:Uncharacterized protein n=1 Tax=Aureoumbra lagunensis TaxID=44058 RepID=A0A7S3JPM2_9STRA|mmetsp:Transcript_18239/g.27498  ORF Transcript_18239/g.27498 Transcript_18239/m.27498 type:complete len:140 (+) Transcript_18239:87-506(+)
MDFMSSIPRPGPRSVGCAKCCAIFSSTGVVFLILIGIILQKEPLYVRDIDQPKKAASQCFGAAGIYIACIVISIGVLVSDKVRGSAPNFEDSFGAAPSLLSDLPPDLTDRQRGLMEAIDSRGPTDVAGHFEMLPQQSMI